VKSTTIIEIMRMGRFHFLLSGFILYTLGSLYALALGHSVTLQQWIWGYTVLMCAHLSVSYSNDYFDSSHDVKGAQTPFSGGSGVLQRMPELKNTAYKISVGLILLSMCIGTGFVLYYGLDPVFIVFIIFGNLLGYYYTSPPLSLSYRGYGELATTIAVGVIVPIMGYLCSNGQAQIELLGLLIPSILYGLVFILTVELPDMEDDKEGSKRTYVVARGRSSAVRLILICCLCASVVYALFVFVPLVPDMVDYRIITMFSLLPLIVAIRGVRNAPSSHKLSMPFVIRSMSSLILFTCLFNAYLLYLIF